jgi:ACR3 family arsenite transporter
LRKRYTGNNFNTEIKPLLPGISAWGALFIIFTAISMNSKLIFNNPDILAVSVFVQAVFYIINYFLVTTFSKLSNLSREDSYALIYSTVLRNLAISIGLATIFGTKSVLIVSLAFLFQPQSALWFAKLNEKYHFLSSK